MLIKLDTFVIKIHQGLVDFFYLDPNKLSKWCIELFLLSTVIAQVLKVGDSPSFWGWVAIAISPIGMIANYTLWRLGAVREVNLYRVLLLITTVLPFKISPASLAMELSCITLTCAFYFQMCTKPPEKRTNWRTT